MVRPKLDPWWTDFARGLFENEPRLNDRQVAERCEQEMAKTERPNPPAQRTVTKWRHQWKSANPEVRMAYRLFHWPQSMVHGLLPWEASRAALEMLRVADNRPSIAAVLWFWRVTQAVPDAPVQKRLETARSLTAGEIVNDFSGMRGIEGLFAYGPWRSAEDQSAYERAISVGKFPEVMLGVPIPEGVGLPAMYRAMGEHMGLPEGWWHGAPGAPEGNKEGNDGQEG